MAEKIDLVFFVIATSWIIRILVKAFGTLDDTLQEKQNCPLILKLFIRALLILFYSMYVVLICPMLMTAIEAKLNKRKFDEVIETTKEEECEYYDSLISNYFEYNYGSMPEDLSELINLKKKRTNKNS